MPNFCGDQSGFVVGLSSMGSTHKANYDEDGYSRTRHKANLHLRGLSRVILNCTG